MSGGLTDRLIDCADVGLGEDINKHVTIIISDIVHVRLFIDILLCIFI